MRLNLFGFSLSAVLLAPCDLQKPSRVFEGREVRASCRTRGRFPGVGSGSAGDVDGRFPLSSVGVWLSPLLLHRPGRGPSPATVGTHTAPDSPGDPGPCPTPSAQVRCAGTVEWESELRYSLPGRVGYTSSSSAQGSRGDLFGIFRARKSTFPTYQKLPETRVQNIGSTVIGGRGRDRSEEGRSSGPVVAGVDDGGSCPGPVLGHDMSGSTVSRPRRAPEI